MTNPEPIQPESTTAGAFRAGWLAHEEASGTDGIGGSSIQCDKAWDDYRRATQPTLDDSEGWPATIYLAPPSHGDERCWCADRIEGDWQEYRRAQPTTPAAPQPDEGLERLRSAWLELRPRILNRHLSQEHLPEMMATVDNAIAYLGPLPKIR